MQTSLRGIANKAAKDKTHRFGALYSLLNIDNLRWCFYQLRKNAACGVDRVTFKDYERNLEANLADLVKRLIAKSYKAKLIKRKYIPKAGSDKVRALGLPALEDKLLQLAVAKLLMAIYDQDFEACSYGYRKGISAHQAVDDLYAELRTENYHYVVEADIRGFFDHMSHDWIVRMLEERVHDKALVRLIQKWLRAGILEEDGRVIHPSTGTPQGGIISPVLSNIYLHYVLDLWFKGGVTPHSEGHSKMFRYADDFVCLFECESDARRFERTLKKRLAKFELEVAEEKTQTIKFTRRGGGQGNGRFDFLGFEFHWGVSRRGNRVINRRTSRKRLQSSLANFTSWIKSVRHQNKKTLFERLKRRLRGYGNYYAIRGNAQSVNAFYHWMNRLCFKWLNRRSQRSSFTWAAYNRMLKSAGISSPRVKVSRPEQLWLDLDVVVVCV